MYKEILLKEFNNNSNINKVKRYINFIDKCIEHNNINKPSKIEKHHILPESLYPDYKNFKKYSWNKAELTYRQHYIAHYMLAKIFGGKQWFAFNQMRRVYSKGILYEYNKKYIIEQIKLANTGRKKTLKERESISNRTKNTVVVKDKEGNKFRISIFDERYLNGELVNYRTGYKHKDETIELMKKNGHKNKKAYNNKNKIIYLNPTENIPDGFEAGLLETTKKKLSVYVKNTIWVTNKKTLKYERIEEINFDPNIYERGRKGFKGFEHINKMRKNNGL